MDILDTPGKRLRALRINAGLKQTELARQLGTTQSHLSRIEGDKSPIYPVVAGAASILGVTSDYLLLLSESSQPEPEGGVSSAETDELAGMRLLELMIAETPADRQQQLVRYLIRQIDVYKNVLVGH